MFYASILKNGFLDKGEEMNKQLYNGIKEQFAKLRVVVIGDVMVDEYVTGDVSRISPEAPIPILNYKKMTRIAGGASNVAHNVAALGAKVSMLGVIGDDDGGTWICQHLDDRQINARGMVVEKNRPTTIKRRFATKSQQLLRVDMEQTDPIIQKSEEEILTYLCENIENVDVVILSDYRKGVLTNVDFVKQIIHVCNENKVIISIDSKSSSIEAFENATFIKPNNLELEQAVGIKIKDDMTLNKAGDAYLNRARAKALLVTRGAKGISLFRKGQERKDFPSKAVQVFDVTGAGDTVISTVTLGIACGMSMEEAIVLGNLAASVVISQVGTVPIQIDQLVEKVDEN